MEFAPLTWRLPAWRCGARNERRPKGYSGKWGERRGSNPRPPEPQSGALPTELRSPQEKLLADPTIIEPPQTGGQFTARTARRSGPGGSAILSVFSAFAVFSVSAVFAVFSVLVVFAFFCSCILAFFSFHKILPVFALAGLRWQKPVRDDCFTVRSVAGVTMPQYIYEVVDCRSPTGSSESFARLALASAPSWSF